MLINDAKGRSFSTNSIDEAGIGRLYSTDEFASFRGVRNIENLYVFVFERCGPRSELEFPITKTATHSSCP